MTEQGSVRPGEASTDPDRGDPEGLLLLRRVKRGALVFLLLMVLGSLAFRSLRVTLGVAIGGGLALLNFRWLEAGLDAALGMPVSRGRWRAAAKFVLRFALLGVGIYAISAARIADLKALLAGLFIYVLAILWESIRLAFHSFAKAGK
jgi:hypothetical protein